MTESNIREALKDCYDPEIPLNVVDSGLICDIRHQQGKVEIDMTLTARGCSMQMCIFKEIEEKIRKVKGVEEVKVNVVWDPPWTPKRISEDGRKIIGYGS